MNQVFDSRRPDPDALIATLRQIGYSLTQAHSDLIDHALSTGAANVLIRFPWAGERILGMAVVDTGDLVALFS